ncbi:hypothetical protein BT96DRAFT_1093699, partial [Gymnopus androsaceus JB14]
MLKWLYNLLPWQKPQEPSSNQHYQQAQTSTTAGATQLAGPIATHFVPVGLGQSPTTETACFSTPAGSFHNAPYPAGMYPHSGISQTANNMPWPGYFTVPFQPPIPVYQPAPIPPFTYPGIPYFVSGAHGVTNGAAGWIPQTHPQLNIPTNPSPKPLNPSEVAIPDSSEDSMDNSQENEDQYWPNGNQYREQLASDPQADVAFKQS